MPYLVGVSDTFKNAVSRTFGYKSKSLEAVIAAVSAYQRLPNLFQFRTLRDALAAWQHDNPAEYASRLRAIQNAFDTELAVQAARWQPVAVANTMAWVQHVAAGLDAMKEFAVGDILAFRDNASPEALDECLARYIDFAPPAPEHARHLVGKPSIMKFNRTWDANMALRWYDFTRYLHLREIRFTARPGLNPLLQDDGPRRTRATGCAICTEFAFAAAHVLTLGRPAGPGVPRVEIVSWSGGGMMAHVFVIVGRQVAPGVSSALPLPASSHWGPDVVIVDTWLAALGHKAAYRLAAGDYPFPGFFTPVRIIMERPAG